MPLACRSLRYALIAALAFPGGVAAQTFTATRHDIGGTGGTDYLVVEPSTQRVFISRSTHVMVVDGPSGKVLGDIPDTPRNHGIALVPEDHHGFITSAGDSTVTMFDLGTLAVLRKIPVSTGGLDGIWYDPGSRHVILTNHSRPAGTAVAIDPDSGRIVATATLEDDAPEGAVADGRGRLYVNNEGTSTIQVLDAHSFKVLTSWSIRPCEGPTGIAYDARTNRIFSGCSGTSVVLDAATGQVVASIANGNGVDGVAWDPAERLLYSPAGRDGNVTVVHQDSPDHYRVVATVPTVRGAKTITLDPTRHLVYLFQPEYGPAPAPTPADSAAPRGRGPRGPIVAAWLVTIHH